jgi:hypothetical protein
MSDQEMHYNDCGIAGGLPHPASLHERLDDAEWQNAAKVIWDKGGIAVADRPGYLSSVEERRELATERRARQLLAQQVADLLDEVERLKALLSEVLKDPTLILGFGVVHRDMEWNEETDTYEGSGEITGREPEGRWRREVRDAVGGQNL